MNTTYYTLMADGSPVPGTSGADRRDLFKAVYWQLRERDGWMHPEVANKFASEFMLKPDGTEMTEPSTGMTFRIEHI